MIQFYGLLHVASENANHENLRGRADPIDTYLSCAALCAKSFALHGYDFRLITNVGSRITARIEALGLTGLEIVERRFVLDVPTGIRFYSAHYKLELYEAFGQGAFGKHVGLVDIDTILLRPFSNAVTTATDLVAYDISETERRDNEAFERTIELLTGSADCAGWWGGELLIGRTECFATLSRYISKVWKPYLRNWERLHHQGDEAPTSAAIAMMRRDGVRVIDAGATGDVIRWWSARTCSPRLPLRSAYDASLLHLPADKTFLAIAGRDPAFDPAIFRKTYLRHATRKALARRLGWAWDLAMRRPPKASPRIGPVGL